MILKMLERKWLSRQHRKIHINKEGEEFFVLHLIKIVTKIKLKEVFLSLRLFHLHKFPCASHKRYP